MSNLQTPLLKSGGVIQEGKARMWKALLNLKGRVESKSSRQRPWTYLREVNGIFNTMKLYTDPLASIT